MEATNRIELFNGFYLTTSLGYAYRQSTADYDSKTFIGEIITDEDPLDFKDYGAFTSMIKFSYTPFQKYMSEPNRKVVLGSKFPTLSASHKKGWTGLFGSEIDFDYIEFMIRQKASIRSIGISEYTLQTGQFLNSTNLEFIDKKRFRQSDPYLYSNPMVSFQLLDTALSATKPYAEVHYLHRFNGAITNNIPLLKKLRLSTVAGAGFLWVEESNFRHQEIFAGIEKIFKVGPRRRLKIGFLGVGAHSSGSSFKTDFKISIDLIDTWKKDWSY